jgi:hypothetical protein
MTGRSATSSYMAALPDQITRLLKGAGRAGGRVIADEAKNRSQSEEVADAIVMRSKTKDDRIVVRVTVKPGWTYSLALWQEYGTSPHFISVTDEQRQGLGIRRINTKVSEAGGNGSLVIGGKFVGKTVFHPGAQAHPFLRPALDTKETEAIKTAQTYINARVLRGGISNIDQDDDA